MNRSEHLARIASQNFDLLIIGGGATGLGCAVDAASRGYRVALLEASDFGRGTSSRSTKLVHGGVRYLEQGNVSLVMEALHERGILRENAPHLVHDLAFVVPNYEWWESPFYGIGLRLYDLLAGKYGFGKSSNLTREETLERIPTLRTDGLRGGVVYYDGQFDDCPPRHPSRQDRGRTGRRARQLLPGRSASVSTPPAWSPASTLATSNPAPPSASAPAS